jgi:hypothetical protein
MTSKIAKPLGSGNLGTVYYGTFLGQAEVAIKKLKTGTVYPQTFLKEAAIMSCWQL